MKDYYQLGKDAFEISRTNNHNFSVVGVDQDEWCRIEYEDRKKLQDGYDDARTSYLKPHWKSVWEKLQEFQEDNNFQFDPGCGCCGGGYYLTVNGIQYSVYEDDLND